MHGTIVDVAVSNPRFSTLVTALQAADLVTTLQGPGPFTVFAPTNDAFDKIPPAILNFLLSQPDALKSVLLYHAVPGANDLRFAFNTRDLDTTQGQEVYVERESAPTERQQRACAVEDHSHRQRCRIHHRQRAAAAVSLRLRPSSALREGA